MTTEQPEKNDIIKAAEFIRKAIGDECGSIFVDYSVYSNKGRDPQTTYTVTVFRGEHIVARVYQSSRLDQACLKVVRQFSEYMEAGQ